MRIIFQNGIKSLQKYRSRYGKLVAGKFYWSTINLKETEIVHFFTQKIYFDMTIGMLNNTIIMSRA